MYLDESGYLKLLKDIIDNGFLSSNRTGEDAYRVPAKTIEFDLSNNSIPLFTTKKIHWKSVLFELFFFLNGHTNNNWLKDRGVRIWNEWEKDGGDLGPIYGKQWRKWESKDGPIDQLAHIIKQLKTNKDCRRMIVSAWNVSELKEMALHPCHTFFQFSVYGDDLVCHLYQRSADMFLGVPFNVASYGLLTHLIAKECNLKASKFFWTGHDCHIYKNHTSQVMEQLSRKPMLPPSIDLKYEFDLMSLIEKMNDIEKIKDVKKFISVNDYTPYPPIKAEVAV